jgi:hypothetical protein
MHTGLDGVDLSRMVIQDSIGDLVYTKGDLAFLMPSAPVLQQPVGPQLGPKVHHDEYEQRQWERLGKDAEGWRAVSACTRVECCHPALLG